MRILVVAHNHPSLHPGGTETVALELSQAYRRAGHETLFLAATNTLHRQPHPGSSFQMLPGGNENEVLFWAGHFDRFTMSQVDLYGVVPDLISLLETFRPDIVHIHHLLLVGVEFPALVRRVLPEARLVMTLHDYYAICANDGVMMRRPGEPCEGFRPGGLCACLDDMPPDRMRLRDRHIRTNLAAIDRFTSPSAFLRDAYVNWGLPPDRIALVPNGRPATTPARPAAPDGLPRVFGYFGNLTPWKGIEVLLRACKRLAGEGVDFELRVHGGAPFQSDAFVERIDLLFDGTAARVVRLGAYRQEDLPPLMAAVDWVVVPSVWWENAPLVISEAFLHRRPVIASAMGGMAEAVKDNVDGLLVPPNDPGELARVMARAASDGDLHRRLVEMIRPPLSVDAVAGTYLDLFRTMRPDTAAAGMPERAIA